VYIFDILFVCCFVLEIQTPLLCCIGLSIRTLFHQYIKFVLFSLLYHNITTTVSPHPGCWTYLRYAQWW